MSVMTHPQPPGFLALPAGGTGPAVLVLHAWWGLNDAMKSFCERLAAEGLVRVDRLFLIDENSRTYTSVSATDD